MVVTTSCTVRDEGDSPVFPLSFLLQFDDDGYGDEEPRSKNAIEMQVIYSIALALMQ